MKDNRLIAEFMGMQHTDIGWYDSENVMSEYACQMVGGNTFEELQYDRSWDWLMPVVETCYHNGAEEQEIGDITHALLDCDLKNLYDAVVEFIKEFNLKSQ